MRRGGRRRGGGGGHHFPLLISVFVAQLGCLPIPVRLQFHHHFFLLFLLGTRVGKGRQFQNGDVPVGVGADEASPELAAAAALVASAAAAAARRRDRHPELLRVFHDVIIRHDVPLRVPDDAGPCPLRHLPDVERQRVTALAERGDEDDGGCGVLEELDGAELFPGEVLDRGRSRGRGEESQRCCGLGED